MVSAHRLASAESRGGKRALLMGHTGFKRGGLAFDIAKTCTVPNVSSSLSADDGLLSKTAERPGCTRLVRGSYRRVRALRVSRS